MTDRLIVGMSRYQCTNVDRQSSESLYQSISNLYARPKSQRGLCPPN